MTASAFIGFALVLAIVVVAAVMIATATMGRKRRTQQRLREASVDDSPTGYTPGVWLLGGDESAAPRPHHQSHPDHGSHHDGHGIDAGGAHGADAATGDAGGGDGGGGSDGGGAH
jgi:uncharacterized membrane protein YgcG